MLGKLVSPVRSSAHSSSGDFLVFYLDKLELGALFDDKSHLLTPMVNEWLFPHRPAGYFDIICVCDVLSVVYNLVHLGQ